MLKTETLKGKIENVVYRNENNDYSVIEISDSEGILITAVGTIAMPAEGENVTLFGSWTYHKEFGKQFAFTSFEKRLPDNVEGILQYLCSRTVKGIGPVTATKIVNRFGEDSFDVLENHWEWLADIPGVTLKKAKAISEAFKEQSDLREVMMFFGNFIGSSEISRVYKALGNGAVGIIKENPYVLCADEYGISFEKADAIAKTLNVKDDSEFRVLSGLRYVLSANGEANGHTCLPQEKLVASAVSLLKIPEKKIKELLEIFIETGALVRYVCENESYVMQDSINDAEEAIINKLKLLGGNIRTLSAPEIAQMIKKNEERFGITYADGQRMAIFEAMYSGIMILTGGPGTGKTTVIKALISIFDSIGLKSALCAPTGRAAKRMSEATSREAKTVHRLLEVEKSEFNRTRFSRNKSNPLDEDVIIVDEASMMDLLLFEGLLLAIKRGARLILIGDADQLPSVGAGNVFSDLIESDKIRTVKLNEIFRQSGESLIITNAHKINSGENPILTSVDNDFFFVRRDDESTIPDTIASLITERLPKKYGNSIKGEIQVITPSKKGSGGVEVLNSLLQEKLNPPLKFKKEKSAHGIIFREGDKVMQSFNNYEIEWEKNGKVGMGIFNGDIGVIERIDYNTEKFYIRFDDKLACYDYEMLDEIELAYSITVHKSQGSEYPVVIVPMYYCTPMLLSRNLFYTAVTRAKRMVILVGRAEVTEIMVKNNREISRYTTLKARIVSNL